MTNLEAQCNQFVDSFCKATGLERYFGGSVFDYVKFHNGTDGLDKYFSWSNVLSYVNENDNDYGEYLIALGAEKGKLTLQEIYKLYQEVTAS